jgi:hypothetical protein
MRRRLSGSARISEQPGSRFADAEEPSFAAGQPLSSRSLTQNALRALAPFRPPAARAANTSAVTAARGTSYGRAIYSCGLVAGAEARRGAVLSLARPSPSISRRRRLPAARRGGADSLSLFTHIGRACPLRKLHFGSTSNVWCVRVFHWRTERTDAIPAAGERGRRKEARRRWRGAPGRGPGWTVLQLPSGADGISFTVRG